MRPTFLRRFATTRFVTQEITSGVPRSQATVYADDPAAIPLNDEFKPTISIPPPNRPPNEPTDNKRARLLYSSRKRGILETDLLLSTFAQKQLGVMSREALDEFDGFLEENDWDIYYWITGAKPVPQRVQQLSFWEELREHSKNKDKTILRMPEL